MKNAKVCSKCRDSKPLTQFYFYILKAKYSSHCKDCAKKGNSFQASLNKKEWNTKKVRVCEGMLCRGEKMFKSINGERYCKSCRESIKKMEDWY